MTTALSFGCEVSDKSLRSLTEVLCCSVGQNAVPFGSLLDVVVRFHKTRSLCQHRRFDHHLINMYFLKTACVHPELGI